jgi:exonuclease VII small subunit
MESRLGVSRGSEGEGEESNGDEVDVRAQLAEATATLEAVERFLDDPLALLERALELLKRQTRI